MVGISTRSLSKRLWEKIDKRGNDECWPWTGATTFGGYGVIGLGRRKLLRSHRVVYIECNGPLDDMEDVRHSCDNPPCCNPRHLLKGTHKDNMMDKETRKRGNHPQKITEDQVNAIRNASGTVRDIANHFNVSIGYVSMVKNNKRRQG